MNIIEYKTGMDLKSTEPMVIRNMPDGMYHSLDRASQTSLKQFAVSVADGLDAPPIDADSSVAISEGRALHSVLLDSPEVFAAKYTTGGPINPTTNKPFGRDTKKFQEWLAEQDGSDYITETELQNVTRMADAIKRDEFANSIINKPGCERELTALWTETVLGQEIKCKARLDWFDPFLGIVDLKSTNDTEPYGFGKSIGNRGWHAQSYWYPRAVLCSGLLDYMAPFGWVGVQNIAPHKVACYRPDEFMIQNGRAVVWRGLQNYAKYLATGELYTQCNGFTQIKLPPFAWSDEESITTSSEEMS